MTEENRDKRRFRIPAITDTARWRQTLYISACGIQAYLKNVESPEEPVSCIVDRKFKITDDALLSEIENTVYDNPMLLDDFSTDIIIETGKYLWVPEEIMNEEGLAEDIYNAVYTAGDEDLMADDVNGCYCLYNLCPGLRAFLLRTFPGSRMMCHISVLFSKFVERGADGKSVYIDIRDNEADYIGFDGKKLLCAGTHEYSDYKDIMYYLFNLMEGYALPKNETQVYISGKRHDKSALIATLRKYVKYVMLTMLPSPVRKEEMPLGAAFSVNRVAARRSFGSVRD